MRTIFIPAKIKTNSDLDELKILDVSKRLPKNIAISYSIQFVDLARKIKEILSKKEKHKITTFIQVLGCSKPNFPKNTEAVLLIGSGKFHAVGLEFETKIPVYVFNDYKLEKVSEEEVKKLETKQKASYLKFLNSESVGILVSTKPGQENLGKSLKFKQEIESKGKKVYLFIENNINVNEFENFQIDSWVNTSCPRMDMNQGELINLADLERMMKNNLQNTKV